MPRLPEFDPYEYLARRRYPSAFVVRDLASDDYTNRRKQEHYVSQAEAYMEELRTKPPEELKALLDEERKKEAAEAAERLREEEASRFFNRPDAQADFTHWSKAAYWTLEEAIALSFGRDPRRVNWKSIESHAGVSPFVRLYRDLRDLAHRAKVMGQLYDPVAPGFFLAWASRTGASIDPHLVECVIANGGIIDDWKTLFDAEKKAHQATIENFRQEHERTISWAKEQHARALEIGKAAAAERDMRIRELEGQLYELLEKPNRGLSTRERTSMIKLIIGMAIRGFGYDPAASRNKAIPEIAGDLDELGIGLDEDTIRKFLNEGKDLLPRDQTE